MSGAGRIFARVISVLVVLALCWPTGTALAVAAKANPVQHSCCMRMAHACHPRPQSGDSIQAVCRACGWCHALPNASAGQVPPTVGFHIAIALAALDQQAESRVSSAPSRLHASRAPPRVTSALL